MRSWAILAAVAALSCATPASAAEFSTGPMNLVDAVSYALNHNPVIAQKRAAVGQALYALGQERIVAFPTVNGTLQSILQKNANYGGAYQIIGLTPQQQFSQNTAEVSTNYTLTTGGYAFLQLTSARAKLAAAQQDLANSEDQIATNVTNAYYMVVQNQAIVTVDQSDLHYQNVLVEAARVKEHAGVAAGVDVLRAQVAQAKSGSTLVGAEASVDDSRESLAQTIGAPLDTKFFFPQVIANPALPNEPVNRLEQIAISARPDIGFARETLVAARATRTSWDRELFPQVQIGAAFGNQNSPTAEQFNPTTGQPLPHEGTPGFWTLSATSTFTLPLVDYGERHFQRVNDDAQVSSAEVALEQATTQAQLDVRQSYRSAQTALAQKSYASDEARLGTESARIAQLQYEHGLIALTDVLQTQQQSVVAQNDYVDAQIAYVNAVVKLRVSLGIYDARSAVADLR